MTVTESSGRLDEARAAFAGQSSANTNAETREVNELLSNVREGFWTHPSGAGGPSIELSVLECVHMEQLTPVIETLAERYDLTVVATRYYDDGVSIRQLTFVRSEDAPAN
jgi:hypothetical protein